MKIRGFFALLWAGLLAAVACLCRAASSPNSYDKAEYRIAMRDSVALYTAVYTPKAPGEAPVIIFRTPYGCGPYGAGRFPQGFEKGYLRSYVDRGYIIVMQDVRGRYMASEGDFRACPARRQRVRPTRRPTATTRSTGWSGTSRTTTVGWVSLGCSYPGFYAMMGGLCGHPAVKAVSPQAPVTDWFMGDGCASPTGC
ncbi:MAG: CocE/NonD family hydrolase [Alistipes onderdonkii]